MEYRNVTTSEEYVARFENGEDWREQIEDLADELEVDAAWFTALGAVQDAELWFYDQDDKEYYPIEFDEPFEVAACVGNVARLDGDRFAHTHAVLARDDGSTVAGHLNRATVFAGELNLRVLDTELVREFDDVTELDLWL